MSDAAIDLHPIPAFTDNYLWLLSSRGKAVVVDPGDAAPVQAYLEDSALELEAILITHHHPDHIGGLDQLLSQNDVPVFGPARESATIKRLSNEVRDGDQVSVLGQTFSVIEVPGHTLGHIAFYGAPVDAEPILLCGDTLFSAGCGRLFEGTPEQMHDSLSRLASLPSNTRVYCTHEYTTANLQFALTVEPDNIDLRQYAEQVRLARQADQPSLPSTIERELKINPFLRTGADQVRETASRRSGAPLASSQEVFAELRSWKDHF